jgi:hypothetical protein
MDEHCPLCGWTIEQEDDHAYSCPNGPESQRRRVPADVGEALDELIEAGDLLAAISDALKGIADWRMVAVRSAVDRVRAGADDPGKAADDLRDFIAQRKELPIE